MKRTRIAVTDSLHAQVRQEAERRRMTVSEWIHEAVAQYLTDTAARRRLLAAGTGHSGRNDTSEQIDEILRGASRSV
jgi:hypothetical protein